MKLFILITLNGAMIWKKGSHPLQIRIESGKVVFNRTSD